MPRIPNGNEEDAVKNSSATNLNGIGEHDRQKNAYQMKDLHAPGNSRGQKKPFLRVLDQGGVPVAAKEIVLGSSTWIPEAPDALVTFITGNVHFDQWRRDDFRSALQGGFIKLINSLNLAIFDDGMHYGLSKVLGDVVREEEMLKKITTTKGGRPPLIGIVNLNRLRDQDYPDDMIRPDDASSIFTIESEHAVKLPLDPNHSHHVFLPNQSYREAGLTRVALEKAIQEELSIRASTDASEAGKRVIPMVAFLFQGELDDLERVKAYCEQGIPVVVMEGCGGLGDVLSAAISDSAEMDGNRLRSSIDQKLHKTFPTLKNSEYGSVDTINLVLDILTLSHGDRHALLLSVVNCRLIDTFASLNSAVLKSAINSSSARASPELFASFLMLAVKCNKPDVATSMLLARPPWCNMELPVQAFEMALILPGREKFVDFYLLQQFPVRKYLSHLKLLKLFREAKDRQFFPEHVWEGILRYSLTQPIQPEFIVADLNKLISKLTGIRDYIDVYELSASAFGENTGMDVSTAERKAMNALLVFAVLFNRPNLVKVLIKYSSEPLLQALFAESLYHGLYRNVSHFAMSEVLQFTCNQFAQIATDLLDKAVTVSPIRGHGILTRRFPDFNNKTPLEIAYDTNNKQFVAHTNVQSWLDQYYFNFVKVKGAWDNLKLFLSAIFIFPMYIWLSFPRLRKVPPVPSRDDIPSQDGVFRPKSAQDAEKILAKVQRIQAGEQAADRSTEVVPRPPFMEMLRAVWAAPAVRFYTWHMFYWMFLILICVDIMLPPCRFIGVDIAVFVLTISMWCEIVLRTVYDMQRFRRVHWVERSYDLISQTVFNILFFLYRIAPYRYDHPFAGRVILAFGIVYYCYRVWGWFYYMDKTIGPLIRVTVQMFRLDLSRWIVLIAPFLISTSLIFMGVINPDWPATGDDWRHAFYRGIFNLFGAFNNELEYTPACENPGTKVSPNSYLPSAPNGNRWIHKNRTGLADGQPDYRCWSGDYNNYNCATISFWSYFFVIQYYVFLKLGMGNMLTAFYVTRNIAAARQGPAVWKYHRCRIILDYATRTSLPPPFYALGYIYKMIRYCMKPKGSKGSHLSSGVATTGGNDSGDSFTYWKGLALEYFRGKEMQENMANMPRQQLDMLTGIQDDLTVLSKKLAAADRKILDVEESTKQTGVFMQDTAGHVMHKKQATLAEIAQPWPHKLARTSLYPGTTVARTFIPNDKVDWKEPLDDYRPEQFDGKSAKDKIAGSADDRPRSRKNSDISRKDSALNLQHVGGYNRADSRISDAVPLPSWITTSDKVPVDYSVNEYGLPLNPFGRTGLQGRGSLQRLGPNHKVFFAITNRQGDGFRFIVHQVPPKNISLLPQSVVGNEETEYGVACLILDAFLFDSNSLSGRDQDFSDIRSLQSMYDAVEKQVKGRLSSIIENFDRKPISLREVYRGYCDSPLNTDNAWLEVVVFQLSLPAFGIDRFTSYKWRVYSSDAGLPDFDAAIVRQLATEYSL
ncbi:putative Transient receptor potential cation channel subfamily M member 6 [Hypsibius exemplaris]|uniref:Transient receptor potential cation channel subfamily M member 6 n=1 Tax=Hypsibius exemplaris TaxID=2072580 RepID=A0A1W0X0J1_HYPEX|nr:putative Transient receptor potential cation channel subfamily M member 6 [Hypsibius exemplaris]